jgi:hypothetical protein
VTLGAVHTDATTRARLCRAAAWIAFAVCVGLWAVGIVFGVLSSSVDSTGSSWSSGGVVANLLFVAALFPFPLTGLLIATRRPGNRIGWLLLAIGLAWGVANATSYSDYALRLHHRSLPAAAEVGALGSGFWIVAIGITGTFLILLFPDGRLPGPGWRAVAWISAVSIPFGLLSLILTPGTLSDAGYRHTQNPFGVSALSGVIDTAKVLILVVPAMMVASAAALIARYRRARGDARQQVKWLAASAGFVAMTYLIVEPLSAILYPSDAHAPAWILFMQDVALLSFGLIPVAIGIAILRHRLFDIDLIVRKTLIYAALVACLAAIYLGGVFAIEALVRQLSGSSGTLAVTVSTLAVAAAFQPLRGRIQRTVDRRFYRGRYDAAQTLEAFSARLREEIDLEALRGDVIVLVGEALHPAHAALWLRPSEEQR